MYAILSGVSIALLATIAGERYGGLYRTLILLCGSMAVGAKLAVFCYGEVQKIRTDGRYGLPGSERYGVSHVTTYSFKKVFLKT